MYALELSGLLLTSKHRLECPCHEGPFDAATGNVLYGPPPRALDVIEMELRDGAIWARGRKAST